MLPQFDLLPSLTRPDKWYLGGGNKVVWTPTFPLWLETLGFWDKASFYNFDFEPVFTLTLLDERGREIVTRFEGRDWNPSRLIQKYSTSVPGLTLIEKKCVLPEDVLASELTAKNDTCELLRLHAVLWTCHETLSPEGELLIEDPRCDDGRITFARRIKGRPRAPYTVHCALGVNTKVHSFAINLSQKTANHPRWAYTPFCDQFTESGLKSQAKFSGIDLDGLVYLALHTLRDIPPGTEAKLLCAAALEASPEEAEEHLASALSIADLEAESQRHWQGFFSSIPSFQCSNPFIEKYYWYRWYGLRLFTIRGGADNYRYPAVCEGPTYFRVPITYSAQCHMLECRWMKAPSVAQGSLLNFAAHQLENGAFVGHLLPHFLETQSFYHANWGWATLELDKVHPDEDFLRKAYESLSKYAAYFDRERDKEQSGLYDVINHYETGQEYMSRYLAVNERADVVHWGRNFQLKGVDATVYLYELKRALAIIANRLGMAEEGEKWRVSSEKTRRAVLEWMWDPDTEMFFDVDPRTMKRTGIKAAVCFYPYLTDMVDERHLPGLKKHLFNPAEFWTPYPIPATSVDDPLFDPDALWKGKRHNCPWNGRVWPMTNSHVAEAMARCARRFNDADLKRRFVEFLTKFLRMMFFDSDVNRPNCFEHYHPFNGRPSVYRGIDDYQHSWVVDLIIKYVAGLLPEEGGRVVIDPFPFGLERATIDEVLLRGRRLKVEITGENFAVWVDGRGTRQSKIGRPVVIDL